MSSSLVPFVHSNFERREGDHYPTIDSRCIHALLQKMRPTGLCIDPCAPYGSGIVDTLNDCGYRSICIADYDYDNEVVRASQNDWIITNPPYRRDIVDKIVNRQVQRVLDREVYLVAMLVRSGFDFAQSRTDLFANCPAYYGQIKMLFRPWWVAEHKQSPIHQYVWQIWIDPAMAWAGPVVLYATGDKPKNLPPSVPPYLTSV